MRPRSISTRQSVRWRLQAPSERLEVHQTGQRAPHHVGGSRIFLAFDTYGAEHGRGCTMGVRGPEPGWYEDPDGEGQRWWDGEVWSEHRRQSQSYDDSDTVPDDGGMLLRVKAVGVSILAFVGFQVVVGMFVGAGLEYDTPAYTAVTLGTLVAAIWAGVAWYRNRTAAGRSYAESGDDGRADSSDDGPDVDELGWVAVATATAATFFGWYAASTMTLDGQPVPLSRLIEVVLSFGLVTGMDDIFQQVGQRVGMQVGMLALLFGPPICAALALAGAVRRSADLRKAAGVTGLSVALIIMGGLMVLSDTYGNVDAQFHLWVTIGLVGSSGASALESSGRTGRSAAEGPAG